MKKNEDIIARKIHECYFLIKLKDDYSDQKCRLYEINEVGYFLWNMVDEVKDLNELASLLAEQVTENISKEMILHDVKEYIDELICMKFIEV